MTIKINSTDVCVQGFERLRTNSEFIISTPIDCTTTFHELAEALNADFQAAYCADPDKSSAEMAAAIEFEIVGDAHSDDIFDPSLEPADHNDDSAVYFFAFCEVEKD